MKWTNEYPDVVYTSKVKVLTSTRPNDSIAYVVFENGDEGNIFFHAISHKELAKKSDYVNYKKKYDSKNGVEQIIIIGGGIYPTNEEVSGGCKCKYIYDQTFCKCDCEENKNIENEKHI